MIAFEQGVWLSLSFRVIKPSSFWVWQQLPTTSALSSSLFIESEFHQVSNCWVRTCTKLDFCSSISNFGSSNMSFSGFFKLDFSGVWVLRVKTCQVFEFRVARSGFKIKQRLKVAG